MLSNFLIIFFQTILAPIKTTTTMSDIDQKSTDLRQGNWMKIYSFVDLASAAAWIGYTLYRPDSPQPSEVSPRLKLSIGGSLDVAVPEILYNLPYGEIGSWTYKTLGIASLVERSNLIYCGSLGIASKALNQFPNPIKSSSSFSWK